MSSPPLNGWGWRRGHPSPPPTRVPVGWAVGWGCCALVTLLLAVGAAIGMKR
jgi:hypothetical protein